MKINIERPRKEEINKIHKVFELTVQDAFAGEGLGHLKEDILHEISEKKLFLEKDFETEGRDYFFLLAKEGEEIVGTISYGPSNSIISSLAKGRYDSVGEIGTVFVTPSKQRQGIGIKLFTTMVKELKERGIKEYVLDSGYGRAQKYWRKHLGHPVFIEKDYWAMGADHMIWHMVLDEDN